MFKLKIAFVGTLLLLVTLNLYANNSKLYLVQSTVGDHLIKTYPTTLYQLNNLGELKRKRAITTQRQGTLYVRPYYDQRQVIIASLNSNQYLQVDIIDMDKPMAELSVELAFCGSCGYAHSYFFHTESYSGIVATSVNLQKATNNIFLSGVDFVSKKNKAFDYSTFQYIQSFGGSRGNFTDDRLHYLFVFDNLPVYSAKDKFPLNWPLPNEAHLKDGDKFYQVVNNDSLRVIISFDEFKNDVQQFHVYDKQQAKWKSFKLKHKGWLKGFGSWLTTEQQTEKFNRGDELYHLMSTQVKSTSITHEHYLSRFRIENVDKTGLLYIINPIENIHIKFDTKHPDSEVILIENNQVIYRVADKIYSAKIKDKQLTKHQLLVQSETVPAIHWAFMGK